MLAALFIIILGSLVKATQFIQSFMKGTPQILVLGTNRLLFILLEELSQTRDAH